MSATKATSMKAVHYEGPFKVSVKEIAMPKIEHPDDAIIKITTSAICGSDLHSTFIRRPNVLGELG